MINDSEVKCFSCEPTKEGEPIESCKWFGKLKEREGHYNRCSFALRKCPHTGCDQNFLGKNLPGHIVDCIHRLVPCKWCDVRGKVEKITAHLSVCSMRPAPCPNRCVDTNGDLSLFHPREITQHRTICALQLVGCAYYRDSGCEVKLQRKDMPLHEQDSAVHIVSFTAKVRADRKKIRDLERLLSRYKAIVCDSERVVNEQRTNPTTKAKVNNKKSK
jgi:hypothetical protein